MVSVKASFSIRYLQAVLLGLLLLLGGGTLVGAEQKPALRDSRGRAQRLTSPGFQDLEEKSVIKTVLRSPKKLFRRIFRKEQRIVCGGYIVVSASASTSSIVRNCPAGSVSDSCQPNNDTVQLTANATDPDNDTILYIWRVTNGRLIGEGRSVTWDLSGVPGGSYTAAVEINDGDQHTANSTTTVTVTDCASCTPLPPCPNFSVSCPVQPGPAGSLTFIANIRETTSTPGWYRWSVTAGEITSGQGTPSIKVDTSKVTGDTVTATIEIGAVGTHCKTVTHSCTGHVRPTQK